MTSRDITVSRFIRGPIHEVFDVWFDPQHPGGPWHGARKVIMNLAVDGCFYFGNDRMSARTKNPAIRAGSELLGHFGRFTKLERPFRADHTWMSELTQGVETTVSVTFEARDGGTELTIVHAGIPDEENGRGHERGWTFLVGRCAEHFAGSRRS